MTVVITTSRAVRRKVDPSRCGVVGTCSACGERIVSTNTAKLRSYVIANVYVDGRWDRVEAYHGACYDDRHGPLTAPPLGTAPSIRYGPKVTLTD